MLAALLALTLTGTTPSPHVDWSARLRADTDRFRSVVLASHPGPVDRENPGFNRLLQDAYTQAQRRAASTTTAAQYGWALDELTAAFDDGHLGIAADGIADTAPLSWPGFVTALRGGKHTVVIAEDEIAPLLGATLVGCDGRSAEDLAAERVGRFVGRWMLRSRREALSNALFLPDNPWLDRLVRCTFQTPDKQRKDVELLWRSVSSTRRSELLQRAVGKRSHSPVAIERLADRSVWINMGSFESDPATDAGRSLTALNAAISAQALDIRRAARIVFDLRGNNGGSSAWITQATQTLWGKGTVADRSASPEHVDWRVSDANIAQVRSYVKRFEAQRATNPAPYRWAVKTLAGMKAAQAQGLQLWSEPADASPTVRGRAYTVAAKVFVLTDYNCASACLDAVDLLTALGAVQVGQETSADTQYMEVRVEKLPDGAQLWAPMKVYRQRRRPPNMPRTPKYAWTGDMGDTDALRRWIADLK